MPVVEGQVVFHQRSQNRDLLFRIIMHNLGNQVRLISDVFVQPHLLVRKAFVRGFQLPTRNSGIIRNKLAVELDVVPVDRVVRIVDDAIKTLRRRAGFPFRGVGQVKRVAERSALKRIL